MYILNQGSYFREQYGDADNIVANQKSTSKDYVQETASHKKLLRTRNCFAQETASHKKLLRRGKGVAPTNPINFLKKA